MAVKVRAYLDAFLPPQAVDEAVDEVANDSGFWGDTEATQILAVAHGVLASRMRVATDVEVLVLNEDVGLSVPGIAAVLALPRGEVRRILDETLAVLADPELGEADRPTGSARTTGVGPLPGAVPATREEQTDRPIAPGDAPPRSDLRTPDGRRRRLVLAAAALVVAAVALAAPWIGLG